MIPLKDNIPTDRTPFVTIALIVLNVLIYFGLQKGGIFSGPSDSGVVHYGAIPYEITHLGKHCDITAVGEIACEGQRGVTGSAPAQPTTILTIFSAMFMHGSILHLAGNMLFLWIFGNNVEDSMGHVKFVLFYLLGGLAALLLQVLVGPDSVVPTIGASGAIAAVLGGYILLYPRARVVTVIFIIFFFTILELPAMLVLGLWFVEQVAFGYFDVANPTGGGGGVAYFAHIGGFVFGLAAIKLFASHVKDYSPPPKYPVY
ncbi:MAG TPA: rhomboid family intramembrane serine protease [Solirubrobacteraceae bacterium]|jgi:membrane associated rhomboid family serine protease|nr:rhomboid family intramembrane serine protease [Solirubrobacteraceae bacterium]